MQQNSDGLNEQFNCLKQKLEEMIGLKSNLTRSFDSLSHKIRYMDDIYKKFLTKHVDTASVIGFDAFYFQKTRFSHEYNHFIEHFSMLLNRVYCDNYKIYNNLKDYYIQNIQDGLNKKLDEANYPIYDQLNIFQVYDFKLVVNLFQYNLAVLNDIEQYYNSQNNVIEQYKSDDGRGIDITNFIFDYENKNNKILLTIEYYIKSINHSIDIHLKFFSKLMDIISLTHYYINNEINVQEFQDPSNNLICPFYRNNENNDYTRGGPNFHMKCNDVIFQKPKKNPKECKSKDTLNETTGLVVNSDEKECNEQITLNIIDEPFQDGFP
jgi:hypothetical protein